MTVFKPYKNTPRTQKFKSRNEQITQILLIYFPSEFPLGTKACVMKTTKQMEVGHIYDQKKCSDISILSQGNKHLHTILEHNHRSYGGSASHTKPAV